MKQIISTARRRFSRIASYRVLAGGLALTLSVLVGTAALMWLELRSAEAQDRRQLDLLATVMEAQSTQVFDNAKLALDSLAKSVATGDRTAAQLQEQQSMLLQGLPFLRSMAVVSLQGQVLASTAPADRSGQIDLQQLQLTSLTEERATIGPWAPGRTLTHDARHSTAPPALGFIPMARLVRVSAGVPVALVAQINPDALATYQQRLLEAAAPGTQVLLALDNGSLLSQVGNPDLPPGSSLGTQPLFQGLQPGHRGTHGPLQATASTPSRSLGAWRRSATHPMLVLVEQPYEATTAQWLGSLRGPLLFMAVALTVIGFLTRVAWRNARAREAAQRERDEAQQETARREQELSVLFRSVQELIFRTDAQGAIRFANPRWQAMTAQPAEMAQGQHLWDVVHPEFRDRVGALFDPKDPSGIRMAQAHFCGPTGETHALDISVVPLRDRSGRLRGFAGSAVDVTALLAAQQRLQEQLAFTGQIFECSPLPICMTDPQGRYLSVNQAWEAFLGLSRTEVLGKRAAEVLPHEEARAYSAHDEQVLSDGGRLRYQEHVRGADGRWRDVQITKVLVPSRQGPPAGILVAKMDITEFLAARDLAEEASRSQAEFVANISHELRTPLQSILGFSELGAERGRHQDRFASMFAEIHDAGQRMLVLVNDLLDIAKIESTVGTFHFDRADVRELIEHVAGEMAPMLSGKRLSLNLRLGRVPLIAKVDPTRFQQVVRNVLGNAVKFSPEDSIIEVAAQASHDHSIQIQVRDQGPGIPAAELETVFQPFVQSSKTRDGSGGTGLGLAICRKIIAAHGGSIHATNAPDGGAIFHIMLLTAEYTDTMPAPLA
ncbi:PAS domain S-box protein [Acidovorax sp.]|uniref:PAS domain S-box protein n=1 Tax=Acidovorax sp. TaxID=1872122 RepID=UPI0025BB1091|nr:PAS domain S-box protein [Acidovorax sp.]MCI5068771.1 PAS domain S-box protein [Acidovorax sp.]